MIRFGYITGIILLLFCISCKKKAGVDIPDSSTYEPVYFKLFNTLDTPIHVAIYSTAKDYNDDTNALLRAILLPHDSCNWALADPTGKELHYYLDWYATGYDLGNWGVNPSFADFIPDIMAYDFRLNLENNTTHAISIHVDSLHNIYYKPGMRKYCINNTRSHNTWKTVGVYKQTELWDTISLQNRYHEFTLEKDMSFAYLHYNAAGKIKKETGNYIAGKDKGAMNLELFEDGSYQWQDEDKHIPTWLLINHIGPFYDSITGNYIPTIGDSLLLNYKPGHYFILTKDN